MVIATFITFSQVILLLVVFAIMNVVILAPIMLALFRAYLDWRENEAIRASRR